MGKIAERTLEVVEEFKKNSAMSKGLPGWLYYHTKAIKELSFVQALFELPSEKWHDSGFNLIEHVDVYLVGGAVRDVLLGKEIKDYDLVVTGIGLDFLITFLKQYGVANLVGVSFGVIKFRPHECPEEEFDIAVPRMEIKTGEGHHGFKIITERISIREDLSRRDFTINSMAYSLRKDELIDPYGKGQIHINRKEISATNARAFQEDPLRMLRAVQFAARFGFDLDLDTFILIQQNKDKILEISGERILVELEKIVSKGNKAIGARLLRQTGLWEVLTGQKPAWQDYNDDIYSEQPSYFNKAESLAEYYYLLAPHPGFSIVDFWKENLKGDLAGVAAIEALQLVNNNAGYLSRGDSYYCLHLALKKSETVMTTKLLHPDMEDIREDFISGKMPKDYSELAINGNILLSIGMQGKQIGDTLKAALQSIYEGRITNEKSVLLDFAVNPRKYDNEDY